MKLLIATHGDYAKGAYSAASIIAGAKDYVTCINAYSEANNIQNALQEYFSAHTQEEIIVLSDLFGGSVNQALMPYTKQVGIYLITGFNLALLLEVMMMDPNEPVDEERLRSLVRGSQQQIVYVNDTLHTTSQDDFD